MRVDKREFVLEFSPHVLVKREQELHESCMRVDKREFVLEFSQFPCPGQTRTRVV